MQAIVDCNSFYCSCERLFQPQLKQAPIVVLSNNDGCIVSRSDEAKQLGINLEKVHESYLVGRLDEYQKMYEEVYQKVKTEILKTESGQ